MQPIAVSKTPTPTRLLFIASIGNQAPYRKTRHSAGHLLLDELAPRLRAQWSSAENLPITAYCTTWYSPSYMNESGPKLVRQMTKWLGRQDELLGPGPAKNEWLAGLVPQSAGQMYPATLVILHDELEAPLGKIRVKRGGPEAASLRGHRGLISVLESLRGKGLYPVQQKKGKAGRDLSILRVGVGIGRPDSRAKNAVADYVLTEMDAKEVDSVHKAAGPVMAILEEELFKNVEDLKKS